MDIAEGSSEKKTALEKNENEVEEAAAEVSHGVGYVGLTTEQLTKPFGEEAKTSSGTKPREPTQKYSFGF